MSLFWAIVLVIIGIGMVIFFAEQLVKAVVGTSIHFHLSAFLISVIFLGFDPENLGVGAVGTYEAMGGIAAGSIFGAAMVAIALALGISALFAPLEFRKISIKILAVPLFAIILFFIVVIDSHLSRIDGFVLMTGYIITIVYLIFLNKKGISIRAGGEVAETLEKEKVPGRWKSAGLLIISLAAIVGGSEIIITGSKVILSQFNLTDTLYGMTILAFLISIEELARELPAALKGKPDIAIGNVIGSILAFFLFNAGIIALVKPFYLSSLTINFYLPVSLATIFFIIILLAATNKIQRWAGIVLIIFYLIFIIAGYCIS